MKEAEKIDFKRPDVQAIMAGIRARVRADLKNHPLHIKPAVAEGTSKSDGIFSAGVYSASSRKAGELVSSEELRYLNTHYAYSAKIDPSAITSHRGGFIGRLVTRIKRKCLQMLRDSLLKEYLQSERDFQAHVVRFLNDVSKYVDARDAASFWELIRKLDYDTGQAMQRIERIANDQSAAATSLEGRIQSELRESMKELSLLIGTLQGTVSRFKSRLDSVESVANSVEALVTVAGGTEAVSRAIQGGRGRSSLPDASYVLLENRFRGKRTERPPEHQVYIDLLNETKNQLEGPVLELGCGRGEFLLALGKAEIPAYGVDADETFVRLARTSGLRAEHADLIKHLENLPDQSLRAIVGLRVLEHLAPNLLLPLCQLCAKKVKPGGLVIFEAVNPQSITALTSQFFRDPSHQWPIHPETLAHCLRVSGLQVRETRLLSAVPPEEQLREVSTHSYLTPRWTELIETMNTNIRALNKLLYGNQGYCVIAQLEQR